MTSSKRTNRRSTSCSIPSKSRRPSISSSRVRRSSHRACFGQQDFARLLLGLESLEGRFVLDGALDGPFVSEAVEAGQFNADLRSLPPAVPAGRGAPLDPQAASSGGGSTLAGGVGSANPNPASFANANPNFPGIGYTQAVPPDTVGDVGTNHYIQMVNSQFQVFDKLGNGLAGPFNIFSLWQTAGVGNLCRNNNNGDPYVVYDHLADRWLISQFAVPNGFATPPTAQCIAISRTADPVAGGWFLYEFQFNFGHDYPKMGLWPDGYYLSSQQGFAGGQLNAVVFDRVNMLRGNAATFQAFTSASPALIWLPSDLDGEAPPVGTPNFYSRHVDGGLWGGNDRVDIMAFSVDWVNPANSTFAPLPSLATQPFDSNLCNGANLFDNCVPQPGTGVLLETLPHWAMGPLQYRNFGSYETLVFNHTVDVDGNDHAGVRWYELHRPTGGAWTIFDQGTYSPDLGNAGLADDPHRWMGSIAMDKVGNLALGYSVSDGNTVFPGIRYTGRLETDPRGLMPQGEFVMAAGGNSQIVNGSRWGDYSAMRVDPADDCTFWYTQQFIAAGNPFGPGNGGAWATQIGAFRFPSCASPPDKFEYNDIISAATVLGSLPKITLRDLSLHSDADVDFFQYTAQDTGKLIVNIYFDNGDGNLDLRVRDASGDIVATGNASNVVQGRDNERFIIPVVSQEKYYIEVFSNARHTNNYDLEIENFEAPVPISIDLAGADDTGMMDADNVTSEDQGTITILADLSDFAAMGIPILTPAQAVANNPGAAVRVFVGGQPVGFATPVGGSGSTLFTFTFGANDLAEGLNFVTAAVRITDGKSPRVNGRSQFSEPLLVILDTIRPATPAAPNLLAASDSGMFDNDNVTHKMEPALDGDTERNAKVRVKADGIVVGEGAATSRGNWEITVEPLRDKVYQFTVEVEDLAGNVSLMSQPLSVEIDTLEPNTPLLDLVESSDTGRHDDDNITKDDTPNLSLTTEDPNSATHLLAANFKYRIFDRLEESAEVLVYDSFAALGVLTGLTHLTTTLAALDDGVHNLKLEVEDRAGNISHDFLLNVLIDTVAPTGTASLFPDSDTGIWGFGQTMDDLVTGDMTPLLTGKTEADALVRVAIDDTPGGTAVAVPLDGDDAFPPPPEFDGNYFLQTILNLDDGEHTLEVFFQDVAGNESPADGDATLVILVDTAGPKIINVTRGEVSTDNVFSFDGETSLFEPKPSDTGPDPLVHSVVIHFSDLPDRTAAFADVTALFEAFASEEGHYQLKGDHVGNIAIVDVNVTFTTIPDDGLPEKATVELVLGIPIPDDRYTLWVSDSITDPAGNPLDGESGAQGPFEGNDVPDETPPIFPTGDGAHGGDFIARFTIDSRPEIGTYALGTTYLDINGNMVFDPEGQDNDYTNRDIAFVFGFRDDKIFAGNFAPAGALSASGYDKLGGYGNAGQGAAWHWRLDFNHDGVVDYDVLSGVQTQGDPVAGNFSAAHPGDEVGLFNAGKWWLDRGGDNNIGGAGDVQVQGNMRGQPIVGDFDGDGLDDLGTWNAGNAGTQFDGEFQFDLANDGLTGDSQRKIQFDLPGTFQFAVSADMNEDGIDDIGLFVTRREAVPPAEAGEWFFLLSDVSLKAVGGVTALNHPFTPVPFGNDLFAQFGDEAARPVVGNFDPPTSSGSVNDGDHNSLNPLDVNNDSVVTPIDALLIINELNQPAAAGERSGTFPIAPFLDVNNDSHVSPLDALLVINYVNADVDQTINTAAEGESASRPRFASLSLEVQSELDVTPLAVGLRFSANDSSNITSSDGHTVTDDVDGVLRHAAESSEGLEFDLIAEDLLDLLASDLVS